MSYARVRRQETKFSDATAIGQSAEGVVAARGDEDDLHGAIRRYYFEFRLDRMPIHGIFHSKRPRIKPAFEPQRRSYRIIQAVRASTDHSAFCVADQLASTGSQSKMRITRGRGILCGGILRSITAVGVAHAAPWVMAGVGVPVCEFRTTPVARPSLPTMSPSTWS
jgi:hypothetical protein